MPILKNSRHELFAQELAKGKSATEAMQVAGYADPRNSTRLKKNDEIRHRVAELQERSAERAEVTVDSLIAELDRVLREAFAGDRPQLTAAVAAIKEKGILSGKRIERAEVGGPGDFERMSDDELDRFITSRTGRAGLGAAGKGSEVASVAPCGSGRLN